MIRPFVLLILLPLAACATSPEKPPPTLSPSEINARFHEFDRQRVIVRGFIELNDNRRCISDSKQDAASPDFSAHDRRLSLLQVPKDVAVRLDGKVGEIEGVFRFDATREAYDPTLCHFSGVDFRSVP